MRSTNSKPFKRARVIRGVLFVSVVMANLEEECAFFTIKKALDCAHRATRAWRRPVQQSEILSAVTVKKPLARLGITSTSQCGFHANNDQEIHWEWNAEEVDRRRLARRAAMRARLGPDLAVPGL